MLAGSNLCNIAHIANAMVLVVAHKKTTFQSATGQKCVLRLSPVDVV